MAKELLKDVTIRNAKPKDKYNMAARHWTPEQRAQQSAKIRQWQPWDKSTGARTNEGKAVSARSAYKGGLRLMMRDVSVLLRDQKEAIKAM